MCFFSGLNDRLKQAEDSTGIDLMWSAMSLDSDFKVARDTSPVVLAVIGASEGRVLIISLVFEISVLASHF